jgi:hypothetical protein
MPPPPPARPCAFLTCLEEHNPKTFVPQTASIPELHFRNFSDFSCVIESIFDVFPRRNRARMGSCELRSIDWPSGEASSRGKNSMKKSVPVVQLEQVLAKLEVERRKVQEEINQVRRQLRDTAMRRRGLSTRRMCCG